MYTEEILVFMRQDPEVAKYAHKYNMVYLPALYMLGLIDAQRKFLIQMKLNIVALIA